MITNDVSELLTVSESVAHEKSINKDIVVQTVEKAIAKAAHARYGNECDIRVDVKPGSSQVSIYRVLQVVENVEDHNLEIDLERAKLIDPEAAIGGEVREILPSADFGRVAIQNAKQVVVHSVREAERERQYEEYKDRIGEVIHGVVLRTEYGNVIVDIGRSEAVVRYKDLIPKEQFNAQDRIRAIIYDVRSEPRGHQVFLSRTRPEFMSELFKQEVPEIYDGIVEIKAVARDPGSRAKMAVISNDTSVDPVGACVGMRGNRVSAVVNELQGERVDIINWSPDPANFVVNAMAPAEVTKVVVDEDAARIDVVLPAEQLSLAIGRRGQNVRLAAKLTGWEIDLITDDDDSDRQNREFLERTQLFVDAMNVDETLGNLLASEGFSSVEDIAEADETVFDGLDGFDEEMAIELINRAVAWVEEQHEIQLAQCQELGVQEDLIAFNLPLAWLIALGKEGILSMEDFAGMIPDDLVGWSERKDGETIRHPGVFQNRELTRKQAEQLIMMARVNLGWIEPEPEPELEPEAEAEAEANDGDQPQDAEESQEGSADETA